MTAHGKTQAPPPATADMVVDPDQAVSTDPDEEDDGDRSLVDRIRSYYRKVFSQARY